MGAAVERNTFSQLTPCIGPDGRHDTSFVIPKCQIVLIRRDILTLTSYRLTISLSLVGENNKRIKNEIRKLNEVRQLYGSIWHIYCRSFMTFTFDLLTA